MDDFSTFILKSEWPIIAGGTLWFCREQVQALIGRIKSFEGPGGVKAAFDPEKEIEQVYKEAAVKVESLQTSGVEESKKADVAYPSDFDEDVSRAEHVTSAQQKTDAFLNDMIEEANLALDALSDLRLSANLIGVTHRDFAGVLSILNDYILAVSKPFRMGMPNSVEQQFNLIAAPASAIRTYNGLQDVVLKTQLSGLQVSYAHWVLFLESAEQFVREVASKLNDHINSVTPNERG